MQFSQRLAQLGWYSKLAKVSNDCSDEGFEQHIAH
jgi:hypothetical protein